MFIFKQKYFLLTLLAAFLAACGAQNGSPTAPNQAAQSPSASEKLGTKWGDEISSSVRKVDLRRQTQHPTDENILRYAAKDFHGRSLNSISLANGKIELSVRGDNGANLPMYRDNGAYYLRGKSGQAYTLVYQNQSAQTYEIVASVDGLDVLNGSRASRYNAGYVLRPHDTLKIEGFRKSQSAVASFIFSQPENAYAAHSDNGSVQNVGVIGTAVFELYDPKAQTNQPNAFPADNGYAPAPK